MRARLWMRWAAGLAATLLLAGLVAWLSGRMGGGGGIHFRLDDATGIEPGTGVTLSGVRAGVVTGMRLDADPSRGGLPRARVDVRLTPEAAGLVGPERWEIVVTTSPLPGFKAEVAFLRHGGGTLPALPDGAWHSRSRSAVANQIGQAVDEILLKLRELSGGAGTGGHPLRNLFPGGGDRSLADWVLNREQSRHLTSILRNVDEITAGAREIQRDGGLARAALGAAAHDNLIRATEELALGAARLRADLERFPGRMESIAGSLERASRSSEEIMGQTTEVLRKADVTLAYINQFLTGLKRNWVFRGAFNEPLEYGDLAPFLVPSRAGGGEDGFLPPPAEGEEAR